MKTQTTIPPEKQYGWFPATDNREGKSLFEKCVNLADKWRKEAAQYQRQVDECRLKNLPHDQMLSGNTFLKLCANELEKMLREDMQETIKTTSKPAVAPISAITKVEIPLTPPVQKLVQSFHTPRPF